MNAPKGNLPVLRQTGKNKLSVCVASGEGLHGKLESRRTLMNGNLCLRAVAFHGGFSKWFGFNHQLERAS